MIGCGLLGGAAHSTVLGNRGPNRLPQLSLHSPVGDLTISEEDGEIVALDWGFGRDQAETPALLRARAALWDYFDGKPLVAVPMAPAGTAYQNRVWRALCEIPAGETRTYIDIARVAGAARGPSAGRMAGTRFRFSYRAIGWSPWMGLAGIRAGMGWRRSGDYWRSNGARNFEDAELCLRRSACMRLAARR